MELIKQRENTFAEGVSNVYIDLTIQVVPSIYDVWKKPYTVAEATDEDIIRYAANSPVFDFLKDPQEDVYSLEDGEQICH